MASGRDSGSDDGRGTRAHRQGGVRAETPLGPNADTIQRLHATQREQFAEFMNAAARLTVTLNKFFEDLTVVIQQCGEAMEHVLEQLKEEDK